MFLAAKLHLYLRSCFLVILDICDLLDICIDNIYLFVIVLVFVLIIYVVFIFKKVFVFVMSFDEDLYFVCSDHHL